MTHEAEAAWRQARKDCPAIGSVWRHYAGGNYRVVGLSIREADLAPLVHYCEVDHDMPDYRDADAVVMSRDLANWQQVVRCPETGQPVRRFRELR